MKAVSIAFAGPLRLIEEREEEVSSNQKSIVNACYKVYSNKGSYKVPTDGDAKLGKTIVTLQFNESTYTGTITAFE